MALQSLQAVDYPFVSLPAPMQVLVMPAGLVVPQVFHLRGQLAQAVHQSGQREGHHDQGGNGAGDNGRVIHWVTTPP